MGWRKKRRQLIVFEEAMNNSKEAHTKCESARHKQSQSCLARRERETRIDSTRRSSSFVSHSRCVVVVPRLIFLFLLRVVTSPLASSSRIFKFNTIEMQNMYYPSRVRLASFIFVTFLRRGGDSKIISAILQDVWSDDAYF